MQTRFDNRCRTGELSILFIFDPLGLCCLQLRSSWDPTKLACVPVKLNTTVLDFIPAIIADIALFLIILSGMLILRRHGGTFGLTRLLWKQVRC